ncbi:MAG: DUF58 domain-containing protein [Lysobacterales bacterium]|jgi:uncharacterized protein (DUF58 family)
MDPFFGIRQAVRRRFRRWAERRTKTVSECRLNHRRLYILPSKAGLGFLVLVAALWLLGTNYENNLVFIICFLLLSFWVVSIHITHGTLSGLTVKPVRAESVFKGEAAAVELCFSQDRPRRREQISLRFAGGDSQVITIDKAGDTFVTVLAPTARRGYLAPGLLTIESEFPVGLMRVWTHIRFRFDAAVYPAPVRDEARAAGRSGSGEGHYAGASGSEDFVALKTFEAGESLRHVAWKQYAREQGLWSKQYADPVERRTWVDWDDYAGMDTEQRLSRMSWKVCASEANGSVYGLRLPGFELQPAHGAAQLQKALRRLALYGIDDKTGAANEAG